MKKFEYKVEEFKICDLDLVEKLNKFGEDGWVVVKIGKNFMSYSIFFKREME